MNKVVISRAELVALCGCFMPSLGWAGCYRADGMLKVNELRGVFMVENEDEVQNNFIACSSVTWDLPLHNRNILFFSSYSISKLMYYFETNYACYWHL